MRSFTFRHLERLVVLLAVVVYLYAAFTLLAHPHGVSGNQESQPTDNPGKPAQTVRASAFVASGSPTKANPETPPFCDRVLLKREASPYIQTWDGIHKPAVAAPNRSGQRSPYRKYGWAARVRSTAPKR